MNEEEFPRTVVEILRILYFSEKPKTSIDLAEALKHMGIDLDSRTIRYHLSHLEERGFVKRLGRKGVKLTELGINEIRRILVYERVGMPSVEIEKLIAKSDYDINKNRGKVIVNAIMVPKDKYELIVPLLLDVSRTNVIISSLLAVLDENESIWNFEVKEGHIGILGISSRTYDMILQKNGIWLQSTATGLYRVENNAPKGFVEIISHLGTTLSPGELLIRGGYTSVHQVARTGSGYVTAAIKTFSSFHYEQVLEILKQLKKFKIDGVAEYSGAMPESKRLSIMDKNKGYLVIYGGANYFAPIVETGISKKLEIARGLYEIQKMKKPEKILK